MYNRSIVNSPLDRSWMLMAEELDVPRETLGLVQGSLAQLEAHHQPTADHCKRVGIMAVRIGQHEDLPLKPLFYGASLHD